MGLAKLLFQHGCLLSQLKYYDEVISLLCCTISTAWYVMKLNFVYAVKNEW